MRQASLWMLVVAIIFSLFFGFFWQEDILPAEEVTREIQIKDIRQKTNITEITGNHYLVKAFYLDPQIKPGDTILISGQRVDVRDATQKYYSAGYANYLRSQKIYYSLTAKKVEKTRSDRNFYTWRYETRADLSGKIEAMYGKDAAMVKALIYGDKGEIEEDVSRNFSLTGTSHVLALSGFHVGIIGSLINIALARFPVKKRGGLTIGILLIYSFVTGLRASILRAVGFFALYYISFIFNQRYNLLASAMVLMAFLLAINPNYIYDMGFTLSFAGVLSIAFFYPIFKRGLEKCKIKENPVTALLLATLSAQVLTLPLTSYYFGILPLVSIWANMIVVPLIGLLMPLAIISLGVHLLGSWLPLLDLFEMGLVGTVKLLQHIILTSVDFLARLPHAHMENIEITKVQLFVCLGTFLAAYLYWEKKTIEENKYESQRNRKIITDQA